MKIINNNNRYINSEVLNQCFTKGKHNVVDKVVCGNGASTAFIKEDVQIGHVNIMIAPNKAVIMDKERAYKAGEIKGLNNRIKFFYQESGDDDFIGADVLMFVSDSFLLMEKRLREISSIVDKVLIDESHSVESQSTFRKVLVDFKFKVESILDDKDTSIVSISASPNHFTKVDIKLKNKFINPIKIYHTKNRTKSIARCAKAIKKGKKVLICTNNWHVVKQLTNGIKTNYIVGETMMRKVVQNVEVIQDASSNITLISSRGFEGLDLYGSDYNVFFFEDRSQPHQTFTIANLYQAVSRCRDGAERIEYCRRNLQDIRKVRMIEENVDRFVGNKLLSVTKKQTNEYKKFHPYVIFSIKTFATSNNWKWTIKKNEVSLGLSKEERLYDAGFKGFSSFLSDRSITIKNLKETQDGWIRGITKDDTRLKYLTKNIDYITEQDLFGDDFNLSEPFYSNGRDIESKEYLKHINIFLTCKNYTGKRLNTVREAKAKELFSDEKALDKLVGDVTKRYNERSIKKYGVKASKKHRDIFKDHGEALVKRIVLMFANKKVYIPSNWVGSRDYNYLTMLGIPEIETIAKEFSFSVKEIDIKSAFPRILYAIAGKELPDNFYGEGKENKVKINVALNNLFFTVSGKTKVSYNQSISTSKKHQKQNIKRKLKQFNIDDDVINVIINKFFDNPDRGALFHFCSYYERKFISMLKKEVTTDTSENDGVVRRHDSLIIFNNSDNLVYLNTLNFLGQSGWVKTVLTDKELKREIKRFNKPVGDDLFRVELEDDQSNLEEWLADDDATHKKNMAKRMKRLVVESFSKP